MAREIGLDEEMQLLFAEAYSRARADAGAANSAQLMTADKIAAIAIPNPIPILCPLYKANKDKFCQWLTQRLGAIPARFICAALDRLCP